MKRWRQVYFIPKGDTTRVYKYVKNLEKQQLLWSLDCMPIRWTDCRKITSKLNFKMFQEQPVIKEYFKYDIWKSDAMFM
ncbi:MAG: hypothetical protein ACMG6E_01305 [Candidatus Roizmanbacteria bacterium]